MLLAKAGDFGRVKSASGEYVPLDIDVSVMVNDDCRKEGGGFTYRRVDGYAPTFCTIGRIGYLLANELRPGPAKRGFCRNLNHLCAHLHGFKTPYLVAL